MRDHPLLGTEEDLAELLKVDTEQIERWKRRKGFDPVGDYSARGTKEPLYSIADAKRQLTKDRKKEST